jgi:hypothetical protein
MTGNSGGGKIPIYLPHKLLILLGLKQGSQKNLGSHSLAPLPAKSCISRNGPPRVGKKPAYVTYKLTDGKQINTGHGRASRVLGYVMEILPGRWVARVRNLISFPSSLTAAKQAAIVLYRSRNKGEPKDWIKELNRIAANEIDRAAIERERRAWPINLMGGNRRGRRDPEDREVYQAILDTERVLEEDAKPAETLPGAYPLEYYEDGYPKLPACVDRRRIILAKAA